jgi:hypothetical protein
MALGMSLGGFVVYLFNPETALALDALTYFLSFMYLRKLTAKESHIDKSVTLTFRELFRLDDYKASIRYLKKEPFMIPIVCSKGALEVATGGFIFLLTLFGDSQFKLFGSAALSIGLLQAARGIGTGAGPFIARRLFKGQKQEYYTIWLWLFVIPMGYFFLGLQSSIWLALIFVFLAHCGGGANWVLSENLIHELVPNKIRGRVISFEFVLLTLVMTLSIKAASFLIDSSLANQKETLTIFVILGVATAFIWLLLSLWLGKSKRWET